MNTFKRAISLFTALLFSISIFTPTMVRAEGEDAIYSQTKTAVQKKFTCDLQKYPTGANCDCHRYVYQQNIKNDSMGGGGHGAGGAAGAAQIAMQRRCMHENNPQYSDYGEYQEELKKIPMSLISPEESNHGDIQAQYLFNKETANAFLAAGNREKADEFFDKNIEILIANMVDKSWAAKNIMINLYKGNLTQDQKEAALQTLNANLPKVGRCKVGICQVPGTVGDVAELFTNCGEDACLLTALQVELFNSLVQSGVTSVTTDEALTLLSNMLVKDVTSSEGKQQKRFGGKQANATVKIPILKAILELGNEDYYLQVTKPILEKKGVMSYMNTDSEVMSFIIETYGAMKKYDPLLEYAFGKNTNPVVRTEAMMTLAEMSNPGIEDPTAPGTSVDILEDSEKQRIANFLHDSYATLTTACVKYNQEGQRISGSPVLGGSSEADAMLKQRMCHAYTQLGVQSEKTGIPCYPCEGNLDADGGVIVAETILSFALDDAVDDVIFGVLTLGVGLVATKMVRGGKYIKKAKNLMKKVKKLKLIGKRAGGTTTSGVSVAKKVRKVRKATRSFSFKTLKDGKVIAQWSDNVTDAARAADNVGDVARKAGNTADNTLDVAKTGKKVNKTKKPSQSNISTKIKDEASNLGNKFDGRGDLSGVTGGPETPSGVHGDANLPNRPATVATQRMPAKQTTSHISPDDAKTLRASQDRVSLRNQRISAIDAEIEESSQGIGSILNKKRIKGLQQERDALIRQSNVDKALSNPNVRIEKRQYGFVASSNGIDAHLSQAELDRYLKDLDVDETAKFYKRNPSIAPEPTTGRGIGFHPQPTSVPSAGKKPIGFVNYESGAPTSVVSGASTEANEGIGFLKHSQNNAGTSVTTPVPEGKRRKIGFGAEGYEDIPTTVTPDGKRRRIGFGAEGYEDIPTVTGGGKGFQDFTAKGPQSPMGSRGPKGYAEPTAGTSNPYNVVDKLDAGPNTSVAPGQGVPPPTTQNISTLPTAMSEDDIIKLAESNINNNKTKAAKEWKRRNNTIFKDVTKVELAPDGRTVLVTKAGKPKPEKTTLRELQAWADVDANGIGLSPQRRSQVEGLEDALNPQRVSAGAPVTSATPVTSAAPAQSATAAQQASQVGQTSHGVTTATETLPTAMSEDDIVKLAESNINNNKTKAAKEWKRRNNTIFKDVTKVELAPDGRTVLVTKAGKPKPEKTTLRELQAWADVDANGIGLSPQRRSQIEGLEDALNPQRVSVGAPVTSATPVTSAAPAQSAAAAQQAEQITQQVKGTEQAVQKAKGVEEASQKAAKEAAELARRQEREMQQMVDDMSLDDAVGFLKGTDNSHFNNPDILSNPDNVAVLTNKVKKNLSDRLDFFQSHYDLLNDRITRAMQKRNLKPSDPDYAKIYRYVTDNWIAENAKNFPHFKKGDDVLKSWEVTINQIKSAL